MFINKKFSDRAENPHLTGTASKFNVDVASYLRLRWRNWSWHRITTLGDTHWLRNFPSGKFSPSFPQYKPPQWVGIVHIFCRFYDRARKSAVYMPRSLICLAGAKTRSRWVKIFIVGYLSKKFVPFPRWVDYATCGCPTSELPLLYVHQKQR